MLGDVLRDRAHVIYISPITPRPRHSQNDHHENGDENGGASCYLKFGAVRPGPGAERLFGLLDACPGLAADQGASVLVANANAGRDRDGSRLASLRV